MKTKLILATIAAVVLTQTGCTTKIRSLPMPASVQTQSAPNAQNPQGVALYFGDQPHASVKKTIGVKEVARRVSRAPEAKLEETCVIALNEALQELRDYARAQNANAVINITTRFQHKSASSATEFMCGASAVSSTLAVSGEVVQLDAN
jgi:uncharacterized protein YbjQ (UPF0145 family)